MSADKPGKAYLPIGCLGALFLLFAAFIILGVLSGEVKNSLTAQWVLAILLIVLGGGGLAIAWKIRNTEKANRPVVRSAPVSPVVPPPSPPLAPGEVLCPSCGHAFVPPKVLLVTEAVTKRYGPNPVQCPQCRNIWSRTQ